MPAKPYVYWDGFTWHVQWYYAGIRHYVRAGSFAVACRWAGAARRRQLSPEAFA